jgi:LysM domain
MIARSNRTYVRSKERTMTALSLHEAVVPVRQFELVRDPARRPRHGANPRIVSIDRERRRRVVRMRRRHLRDLGAIAAVLAGTWFGAGVIGGTHAHAPGALPGAVRVSGGLRYTVRPGDTLWSIASRLDPSGDPRAIVDAQSARLGGTAIVPGEQLLLP